MMGVLKLLEYDAEKELMIIEKDVKLIKEKIHPMQISYRGWTGNDLNKEVECIDSSNIKDMSYMFAEIKNVNELDVRHFDTSNVTNMTAMFYSMINLEELDLSNFNTSNVTSMTSMFQSARMLKNLDISNFNTSQVTNMSSMFSFCTNLKILDLSSFDTSQVTTMNNMCLEMSSLEEIKGILDLENVTNANNMLSYCQKLKEVRLKNLKTNLLLNTTMSLSDDSVNYLLLNVQDVSVAPKTITLGPNMPKASKEALEHATSLGWTVI